MLGDYWLGLYVLPRAVYTDAEEQPEDKQRKAISSVDEVQPAFGNYFPTWRYNFETGEFFKVAIQMASAMPLSTRI